MFDFDYMAPELIPSALRCVKSDETIKINGIIYAPERTCRCENMPYFPGEYEGVWCSECHCIDFEPDETPPNYCPNCGAKVVE